MSDSDDDLLENNVFMFQNDNMTISARGPHINSKNITGLSFHNNVLTSTMHVPVKPRKTSPISLRSVNGYGPSVFSRSTYQNEIGCHRSMYNGRGQSASSVRSIDTSASVSAADIVFAFKNVEFNKYDLRMIKDAYNKLIKTKQRKRIEKRRNLKLFLKGTRWKSGEDSGEQGSDSSVSDDGRSTRSAIYKENLPYLRQTKDYLHFGTSSQGATNASHFSSNLKDNEMFTDCTNKFKQSTIRNMISINSSNSNSKDTLFSTVRNNNQNLPSKEIQNISQITQKERFKRGFLLPSQRFNNTVAIEIKNMSKLNNSSGTTKYLNTNKIGKNRVDPTNQKGSNSDSDQEEIFSGLSVNHEDTCNSSQRKRTLDTDNVCHSNKKKSKLDTPEKLRSSNVPELICNKIPIGKSSDFIFAKPKMPPKKGSSMKSFVTEKLLAKSRVPIIDEEINFNLPKKDTIERITDEVEDKTQSDMQHSNTDVSMRPSFIKRKLFTQKLDMAERKNTSSDSIGENCPQNIYSASLRDRNKTRKLVTLQSCLSREVPGEDSNVLDLIHKIVPPDQINITSIANKTDSCNNKSNDTVSNSDKWDVTAVIANCDNQDISDTYTDEEIFNVNHDQKSNKPKNFMHNLKELPQCKVVIEKSQPLNKSVIKSNNNDINKKSVTNWVKSFWDTDIDSDMEFNVGTGTSWKTHTQQLKDATHDKSKLDVVDKQNQSTKNTLNYKGTILTVRNCHKNSKLNDSLKCHRSVISGDKQSIEINKPDLVVKKGNSKVGKNKKENNAKSQTGKKKDSVKENVPNSNETEEPGRVPKTKPCMDCSNTDKPTNASKHDNNLDPIDNKYTLTCEKHSVKTMPKHKVSKSSEPKQSHRESTNKVSKAGQKTNAKTQKMPVTNVRIQPKRKSKENSFVNSSKQRTVTGKTKVPNARPKTNSTQDLIINNISLPNISTMTTRSKEKLSINSSGCDSSMNISGLSNRSLRFHLRVERKKI